MAAAVPTVAHGPMMPPAAVLPAPVTEMMLVAEGAATVPRPVPAAEKVTAEVPDCVRPPSVSVCLLPLPPTWSVERATFNWPLPRATVPSVSA